MPALLVAAVHNGELSSSPAKESLRTVKDVAQELGWSSRLEEITAQPPLDDRRDATALTLQDERQRSAESAWDRYLGADSLGRRVKRKLGRIRFLIQLRVSPAFAKRVSRQQQIQSFVTSKHLQAAAELLAGEESFLLVLESDAVTNANSGIRLTRLLQHLNESDVTNVPVYVNLAGGRDLVDLAIPDSWWSEHDGIRSFTQPVSNTACAYLIDRSLAGMLLAYVEQHAAVRMLGIDWVMNGFFESASQVRCLHAEPPIFDHGSMRGVTPSWQTGL